MQGGGNNVRKFNRISFATFIDFINARITNSKLRFVVSLIVCTAGCTGVGVHERHFKICRYE